MQFQYIQIYHITAKTDSISKAELIKQDETIQELTRNIANNKFKKGTRKTRKNSWRSKPTGRASYFAMFILLATNLAAMQLRSYIKSHFKFVIIMIINFLFTATTLGDAVKAIHYGISTI